MTLEDAARYLKRSPAWVMAECRDRGLEIEGSSNQVYFQHGSASALFQLNFNPKIFVFQILKGGTGKTSLAYEFAIRANLYGARVVCIDLDQQGNLTSAFNQNAEENPVMIDVLAEGYGIHESLLSVTEGLDLLPSRIENALLDEVLRLKKFPLETVYANLFQQLKQYYDVIIVDCPPSLGQSVAASALSADQIITPIIPEKFALMGLKATHQSLEELELAYHCSLPYRIVLNKFETENLRSQQTLEWLMHHEAYQDRLLKTKIRLSEDFPEAALKMQSIFDQIESSFAKTDVDAFTRALLEIDKEPEKPAKARFQKDYIFA